MRKSYYKEIKEIIDILETHNNAMKDLVDIIKTQDKEIEMLKKKIDKLPDFAEWYIKNSAGGYQE